MSSAVEKSVGDVDWLLALLAAAVAAAAWALFWFGGVDRDSTSSAPPIATLASSLTDVRRRASGTLVWEELSSGAVLSEGDALFIPPSGGATVKFVDGTLLDLDENTLVALEKPDQSRKLVAVRVDRGQVVGAPGDGKLELRTSAGTTSLERGARARLELGTDHTQRVEVLEGAAQLADGSRVGANESALSRDNAWRRAPAWTVELSSPRPMARLFFAGEAPGAVRLEWRGEVPEGATLQVDRRGGSGPALASVPAAGGSFEFVPPEEGGYRWRLVDARGQPLTETRRFRVVRDTPPVIVSPRPNELIHGYLGRKVPLAWSRVPGARHYEVEASDTPEFAQIVFRQELDGTSLRSDWALPEGRYYWRVRTRHPDERGESPWSPPSSFRYLTKALPDAPELIDSELELDP